MDKNCAQCSQKFEITDEDLAFYDKVSPVVNGKKYQLPEPDLCPDCRLQNRMTFRHGGNFFHRKCDLTGKDIITAYIPESKMKVYEHDAWWTDKWDAMDYARDVDFSRPFFEQFEDLFLAVPHASLANINSENSYYCNHALNLKNSYFLHGATNDDSCMYGHFITSCNSVVDSTSVTGCEHSYEGINSNGCYECKYFENSSNCISCMFIDDCQSCEKCIACFGLKHKKYHIFNKDVGREVYEKYVKENLNPLTRESIKRIRSEFDKFKIKFPHRPSNIKNSENCTGDMIINSKNCHHSFTINKSENCKFICNSPNSVSSYDCSYNAPNGVQFSYNCLSTHGQNLLNTWIFWGGSDGIYAMECHNCNFVFGCVGLKKKQYCIFNRQYSKEEYFKKVAQIIEYMQKTGEWGQYFPLKMSPHDYNDSAAIDYFPLSKSETLKNGYKWSDYETPLPAVKKIIAAADLPKKINEVDDTILENAIECEVTHRPFIITRQELQYYRKNDIPLPLRHPEKRQIDRADRRNLYRLWERKCANCNDVIFSVISPDRPEIVYCEKCYLASAY